MCTAGTMISGGGLCSHERVDLTEANGTRALSLPFWQSEGLGGCVANRVGPTLLIGRRLSGEDRGSDRSPSQAERLPIERTVGQ
jgi:hypothetical protein